MGQVTWRAPDALVERVQHLAAAEGTSMNEFLNRVLTLATDSNENDPAAVRLRNRLRASGMLAQSGVATDPPSSDVLDRARAAAGQGVPLSEVVSNMRK